MKTLVTAFLALTTSLAIAQKHTSITRNINDDGKTLSIQVQGTVDDKPIDYDRTFDVSNLNKDERNALREHILDSLNVSMPEPPRIPAAPRAALAPHAPLAPRTPLAPASPVHPESIAIISSDQAMVSVTNGDNETLAVGGKKPYIKEVKYDSNSGQLYLRYKFKKDDDDFTYERTIDAKNKSQQERQQLIDDIEKTIGVPKNSK